MTSTKDKTREQEAAENTAATSAGEHAEQGGKFAGLDASTLEKMTVHGKPYYKNIITDPNTGAVISAELTDEAKQYNKEIHDAIAKSMQPYYASLKDAAQAISKIIANKDSIRKSMRTFSESLQKWRDILQPAFDLIDELRELKPYIEAESKNTIYNGLTFDKIMENYTPGKLLDMLADPDSDLSRLLQAARAAKQAAEVTEIVPYHADKLDLPLDKINCNTWGLTETGGQIQFNLAKRGTHDPATGLFSLSFAADTDTKISKQLTQYDKRVSEVIDTGYENGENVFTLTGIYHNMGNTKRPGNNDFKKINESLNRLGAARVFFDNSAEAEIYNYKHVHIKDAALLYFKRITVTDNGKVTDGAIQVLEEPALMQLARERKQITAVPTKVLQSGISMTEAHLKIEDYLLQRITQRKHDIDELLKKQRSKYTQKRAHDINEKSRLTILIDTLLKSTGNDKKDSTGKARALDTAGRYLYHYKSQDAGRYITGYVINKNKGRIEITLPIPAAETIN